MGHSAKSPGPIAPKPSVQNVDQSTSTRNTCSAYITEAMLHGMEPFGHLVCSEMARRMVRNHHFTSTSSRCKYFASLDLQCYSCEVGGHKGSKWGNPTYFMAVATDHGGGCCSHPGYASSSGLWNTSSSHLHPRPLVHELLTVEVRVFDVESYWTPLHFQAPCALAL